LDGVIQIPVNDHDFMQRMMTEHGKILPARLTGATAKQQRRIRKGVRRLRVLGLVP
jgi:small subunit ribosomal protein S18